MLAFMLSFSLPALQAQTSGGSSYSVFGLGDIVESHSAAFDGTGGAGMASTSEYAVNLLNPAAWNAPRSTRFKLGFNFRQFINTNAQGLTVAQNGGFLQGFSSVFSIDTVRGISAGFGVVPVSTVQYAYSVNQTFAGGVQTSTLFRGLGGLTGLYLGGAYQILPKLHLGLSGQYNFGTVESEIRTEASSLLNEGRTIITDVYSGATGKLGVQFTGIPNLSIAAVAGLSTPLAVSSQRRSTFSAFVADSVDTTTITTQMPLELGIGLEYRFGRFALLADVISKDFSAFNYRTKTRTDVSFRRSNRVSIGLSFTGENTYSATFLQTLGYSIGAGYHQQYYQVAGRGIDEIYGSLGVQVPVARRVFFDLAATIGVRGTTDNNLIRELFGRFTFSVNVGEIWFQPFLRE
ncbi:MAG: hypothetical protein EAZ92_04235 [Candidatus Kapaibacterium sp.]|nr:MAG: hypothetical protein EAZ92_04235 [Candidatus Kapabacteria bacterium]